MYICRRRSTHILIKKYIHILHTRVPERSNGSGLRSDEHYVRMGSNPILRSIIEMQFGRMMKW